MTARRTDEWQLTADGRTRLRRPFRKNGTLIIAARYIWTAEELDIMEFLAEKGVSCEAMRSYFDPRPSAEVIQLAMRRAGIAGRWERYGLKKPSKVELSHRAKMESDWREQLGVISS